MRLFFALSLEDAERARLERALAPLRASALPIRWTAADALHLTIAFLGEVPEDRLPELEQAGDDVASQAEPFTLRLRGLGAFPNLGRPRVVWVGIGAQPALDALHARLTARLAPLGFPPEQRPFSAHLTVGRVRADAAPARLRGLEALAEGFHYEGILEARTLDLMRSHLSPKGARYERLAAARLGS